MQMEKVPPSKIVKAQLPPAEPPPSLENKEEETQWIQDTTTMATKMLRQEVLGKITVLSSTNYTNDISASTPSEMKLSLAIPS